MPVGPPERRVRALGGAVMEHDEVPHPLVLRLHRLVVLAAESGMKASVGQIGEQVVQAELDKEDAGRLQRLDEAARQADGDTVLYPGIARTADAHLQMPRLTGLCCRTQVTPKLSFCLLRREKGAPIDIAIAAAAHQRCVPHPAGAERGGYGERVDAIDGIVGGHRQRDRAVAEQRVTIRDEWLVECAVDQESGKPGAIKEEVPSTIPCVAVRRWRRNPRSSSTTSCTVSTSCATPRPFATCFR